MVVLISMVKPNRVGRPPETDTSGKRIKKSVISINIPQGLVDFLDHVQEKNPEFNRSQFFSRVVTALYAGEICHFCYGQNLKKLNKGLVCKDCSHVSSTDRSMVWKYLEFYDCPNCGTPYDYYNEVKFKGQIRGCTQTSCFEEVKE